MDKLLQATVSKVMYVAKVINVVRGDNPSLSTSDQPETRSVPADRTPRNGINFPNRRVLVPELRAYVNPEAQRGGEEGLKNLRHTVTGFQDE